MGDEAFAHDMAQSILQLHVLDEEIMFRVNTRR